jgi:DNA-binding LacI/PurR family transcriptional regulator
MPPPKKEPVLKSPSAGPARTRRDRPATLTDVARAAGVSRWIAGAILNGGASNSRCAPETAAQIRAAAAKLEYRPNLAARLLSGKRSHAYGLLVASAGDPLVAFLMQELHVELARVDCQAIVGNTFEGWDRLEAGFGGRVEEFARRGIDGVFCAVHRWWPGDRRALVERFPATVFYEDPEIEEARFVAPDRHACGRIAVEHLAARGRRRIGLALMTLSRATHRARLAGHAEALAAAGLAAAAPPVFDASRFGEAFPVHNPATRLWDYPAEIIDRCIDELVRDGRADAIVAHDDFFAAVLLKRLRARGIRVPDDVAVVGYLNHYLADWVDPPLTTIDLDQAAAAKAMVEMAERLVKQGEDAAASSPLAVLIPPRLIVRESA